MAAETDLRDLFSGLVHESRISDSPQVLESYASDHSFVASRRPDLVIRPAQRQEIEDVMRAANLAGVPVYPVSSSPPRFNGDTIPTRGGVVLDLSGMKSIGWIDRRNRAAFIEPGVTYAELTPGLEEEGLRVLAPLAPRSTKSVISACLEREPTTMPRFHWAMTDPLASTEFVLGSGDVLRAGEAGTNRGSPEEQRKRGHSMKHPFGVYMMNIARICSGAQGTVGVCRWATIRCELLPEQERLYFLPSQDLEELTRAAQRLVYLRLPDHVFILNDTQMACLLERDEGPIRSLAETLPPYVLVFTLGGYGADPAGMLKYKLSELESERMGETGELSSVASGRVAGLLRRASDEPYFRLWLGEVRSIFFQTSLTKVPYFTPIISRLAHEYAVSTGDIGIYIQPQLQGVCCHTQFDIYFRRGEEEKIRPFMSEAAGMLYKSGAFFSRPYGDWADMVFSSDYRRTAEMLSKFKGVFDPSGILSPGRLPYREA